MSAEGASLSVVRTYLDKKSRTDWIHEQSKVAKKNALLVARNGDCVRASIQFDNFLLIALSTVFSSITTARNFVFVDASTPSTRMVARLLEM